MSGDIEQFFMTQFDLLPKLRRQLLGPDGLPLDLTGATVVVNIKGLAGMRVTNGVCVVLLPATDGWVEYTWVAPNTDVFGNFWAKFRVTLAGKPMSVPNYGTLHLLIDEDLR